MKSTMTYSVLDKRFARKKYSCRLQWYITFHALSGYSLLLNVYSQTIRWHSQLEHQSCKRELVG